MNNLIAELESLEEKVAEYEKICTLGVQPKIEKLNKKIYRVFERIAKSPKATEQYEEYYGCDFEWDD